MKSVVLHLLLLLPHHAQLRETAKFSRRTYACAAVGLLEEEEEEEKNEQDEEEMEEEEEEEDEEEEDLMGVQKDAQNGIR